MQQQLAPHLNASLVCLPNQQLKLLLQRAAVCTAADGEAVPGHGAEEVDC